jgi:neutral ceramidase
MRAGLGRAVITPSLPVYLAGYGDRRDPATTVHDDLEVHVLVIEVEGRRAALVTLDLLAMSRDCSDPIRSCVGEVVGCDPDAVLTSCCHVHAGPSALTGTEATGWPVPTGYAAFLVDRVADAARAVELEPVTASFARIGLPAGVAINRRGHRLAPSAAVLVLDPVVTIANFGIHPTVTGPSNLAVATDWVGPFRRELAARTGRAALFLQGCQGDVNPAVTAWDDGDPAAWSPVVEQYAVGLADAVAAARPRAFATEALTARSRTLDVPVGPTLLGQLAGGRAERTVELLEWTLGGLQLVAVPGEAFHAVEAELRVRRRDPLLIAGLAPDWHGYLPLPYTDGYEEGLSLGPDAVAQLVAAL